MRDVTTHVTFDPHLSQDALNLQVLVYDFETDVCSFFEGHSQKILFRFRDYL